MAKKKDAAGGKNEAARCVYTVLLGGYEKLNEQPMASRSGIPFICLTDDPALRSGSWQIRLVRPQFPGDPVRSQRMMKILAHEMLPEFDASLYIDNTVVLSAPPETIFARYLAQAPIALFAHSFRDRLGDEFTAVAGQGLDDACLVEEQRTHYAQQRPGILDEPVMWTGVLMRRHDAPAVRTMCEEWARHVLRYSQRDQLSVSMALGASELATAVIEEDNHRSWFHSWPHRRGRVQRDGDRLKGSGGEASDEKRRLEAALRQRTAEVQLLKARLAASQAAIRSIRGSHSWRVTAPLRAAVTAARSGLAAARRLGRRPAQVRRAVPARPLAVADASGADAFGRDGFLGPVRLFSREQCDLIMRHYSLGAAEPRPEWPKDRAVIDPFFLDLAMRPQILARLAALIGPDVAVWGASVVEREPGQVHLVHTDIESSAPEGGFVSVWIGLDGTSRDTALAMITRSQSFGRTVQQVMHEAGLDRKTAGNEAILALARERDPEARLVQPEMADGDALFMDGRIWHGSSNTSRERRTALLLQYAAAGADVPVQQAGSSDWPFKLSGRLAQCLPVLTAGRAADVLAGPHGREPAVPVASPNSGLKAGPAGFSPFHILRGATANVADMESHVSVLDPGHSPHPPHCHVEEELLVVLDGEAEIVIPSSQDDEALRVERLTAGGLAYYPAYQHHTIRNASARPVTYVMLKWRAAAKETEKQLGTLVLDAGGVAGDDGPISMPRLFEGPTGFLTKLHAHLTVMQPGAGYAEHADAHDVAIVVLEGSIETLGRRLGPGGTAFSPAGSPHGLSNPGQTAARYLVFEFHA